MGGRNGNHNRTLRIRYRTDKRGDREKRVRSTTLVINGNPKRIRRFKGGKILRISKVSQEEQLRVGEFSPFEFEVEAQQVQVAMRRERKQLDYHNWEIEGSIP